MGHPKESRLGIARLSSGIGTIVLGLFGAGADLARGQGFVLAESDGSQGAVSLGWSVSSAGDVDGDGVPDLLMGAAKAGPHGRVNVVSGATRSLLLGVIGPGWNDGFGAAVASAGDVNGDGVSDVVVGAPTFFTPFVGSGPGSVTLFSGADGAVFFTVVGTFPDEELGASVSGAGDVNGDGVPDVIVGAPGADPGSLLNAGEARILSGVNGSVLRVFGGSLPWDRLGTSVAGAGDLDGDGLGEVVVGVPYAISGGWSDGGLAQVFSGGSGALLFTLAASLIGNAELGTSVAGGGDLNADGVPDLLVGAPGAFGGPVLSQAGQVRAFSGATGGLLLTLTGGTSSEYLGKSVASAGDVDADGVLDVVAGGPDANVPLGVFNTGGRARVFSGASGANLFSYAGTSTSENLGWSVAGAGDLDGDGSSEFLVGASYAALLSSGPFFGAPPAGRVTVHSGATGLALSVFDGNVHGERSGFSIAGIGDVDGDGIPDAIAGAPFARAGGAAEAGVARILSGTDATVLLELAGSGVDDRFGWSVSGAGDVDGDGVPDAIVGAPGRYPAPGRVVLCSGTNGGALFTVVGTMANGGSGYSVAAAGDVNLDGIPDILVGAPAATSNGFAAGPGTARVLSGTNAATLLEVTGSAAFEGLGYAVAGLGDVNGDGSPDFAAGVPSASPGGVSFAGAARVFSGANGLLLLSLDGTAADDMWGLSVAGAGDSNGDGVPDVLVGTPKGGPGYSVSDGRARLFSGSDGTLIRTFVGTGLDQLGKSLASAGDVDGDGVPDVAIGVPSADSGAEVDAGVVRIFSGQSGALLATLTGSLFGDLFGTSVASAGDLNGDGVPDLVVAAPYADPGEFDEAGQVRFLSVVGTPPGAAPFGSGCAGTGGIVPSIAAFGGPPAAGNAEFGLAVTRGLGGAPALLFLGSLPYAAGLPLGGCSLYLDGAVLAVPPAAFLSGPFGSPGAGHRLQGLPIPGDPSLVGASGHFQWAVLDLGSPNGLFTTSNALSIQVM